MVTRAAGQCRGPHRVPSQTSRTQRQVRCNVADPRFEGSDLAQRIASGKYGNTREGSKLEKLTRPARKLLSKDRVGPGRWMAKKLAEAGQEWSRRAAAEMPSATGDIREIVDQPVFVPLYSLFRVYGPIFKLSFGPQSFVVISDPSYGEAGAREPFVANPSPRAPSTLVLTTQVLLTNASKYSKGILSEILDFVMGQGLIPADGEVWKTRRRKIVPSIHKNYIESMVGMFGDSAEHCIRSMQPAADKNATIDMENYYSRLALDIIGKAVFNYEFNSLSKDDPVIQAVYTTLREAEHRSLTPIPYWRMPFADELIPRQKRNKDALILVNNTLNELIAESKAIWDREQDASVSFDEDSFLSRSDPSILHFLIASGDDITSKQLRDDLMTMLIAGHETTAAVLTWTTYLLATHPDIQAKVQAEVDEVIGDEKPTLESIKQLKYTMRVINESMRLYPQPPVLIRRALEDDVIGGFKVNKGSDMFISVWNLHRSPVLWEDPDAFNPDRFGPLDKIPNEATTDFAYLPFGGGKRKCIGDQFALFESVVALAMLQRKFNFDLDPEAPPVGMTTGATIHTTEGLNVKLRTRMHAPPNPQDDKRVSNKPIVHNGVQPVVHNGASMCPMHASAPEDSTSEKSEDGVVSTGAP